MIPQTLLLLKSRPVELAVVLSLAVAGVIWAYTGRHIRGGRAFLWFIVPAMFGLALLCVAGPGHFFPKRPFEGATIVQLSPHSGITTLDLVGVTLAATATLIGGMLLRHHAYRT